ncbi:Cj0814 family flagellar-dependent secreted protein [Helicobacter apodemus]|uniref:Uncharacterized protein n=1 Tax=Helicobacter apodemus TaxID=135569 RepID=A0A2U8FBL7_9HELI|nr:hypothetical protein [Helicobacter apodemus]AWI33631.1 hypothetical protein CDV25_01790 [Helicobacter apodemus]
MIGSLNSSFSFNNYALNISNNLRINNTNASNSDNVDNTNIKKNNQSIESKKSSLAFKEILGYKVDKEGYFTQEFNKAAGIPEDYKIHSSSLESLVRVRAPSLDFTDIDIAKTIGNAYKILSQVVGEDTLKDKDSFSLEEIAKFPQGYEYDRRSLQVTKIYQTTKDYMNFASNQANWKDLEKQDKKASNLFFSSGETMRQGLPATDIFNNASGGQEESFNFNPNGSKYINEDGSITKGGLLVAVVNKLSYTIEGTTTIRGKGEGYDKSLSRQEVEWVFSSYLESLGPLYATGEDGSWLFGTDLETFKKKHSELMKSYQRKLDQWRKEDEEFEKNYKSPMQIMLEELDEAMKKNLKRIQKKKQEEKQRIQQAMKKLDINV